MKDILSFWVAVEMMIASLAAVGRGNKAWRFALKSGRQIPHDRNSDA
jgi:hypothetical protein